MGMLGAVAEFRAHFARCIGSRIGCKPARMVGSDFQLISNDNDNGNSDADNDDDDRIHSWLLCPLAAAHHSLPPASGGNCRIERPYRGGGGVDAWSQGDDGSW